MDHLTTSLPRPSGGAREMVVRTTSSKDTGMDSQPEVSFEI